MSGLNLDGTHDLSLDGTNELDLNGSGAGGGGAVTGTWASTEAKDTMDFTGTVPAPPPVLDTTFGTLNVVHTGGTSFTAVNETNKTAGGSEVVVCILSYDLNGTTGFVGQAPTVSGLTFTRAFEYQNTNANSHACTIEVWTAPASSQFNPSGSGLTWTFNFSSAVDNVVAFVFAVEGCNSITAPFDTNMGLPGTADNSTNTTPPTVTFSTSEANDLLVAITAQTTSDLVNGTTPSGWTNIGSNARSAGTYQIAMSADYKSVTTDQSGATYTNANTNNEDWTEMVLAFNANPPPPPSGTWASTEAKDTMAARGGLLGGTWASTEAKDQFNATNTNPRGVWASTEAKDTFAATVDVVPALAIDTTATGGAGGVSSPYTTGTVTLSTNYDDEIIVLQVVSGGFFHSAPVTSVTDTAGLTWHRRNHRQAGGGEPYVELWWAHAPTPLSADVITVTTGPTGAMTLIASGVVGANTSTPWDKHTLAGWCTDATPGAGGGTPIGQFSTQANKTLVLAYYGSSGQADAGTITSPFTYVVGTVQSEHSGNNIYGSLSYDLFDSPQTQQEVSYGVHNSFLLTDTIVCFGEPGTADPVQFFFDNSGIYNASLQLTGGATSMAKQLTITNHDMMIVAAVLVQSQSGLGTVSSITDSAGAFSPGFERRSRKTNSLGTVALEIWYAYAANPLSADNLTFNFSNVADGDIVAAYVCGIGNTSTSLATHEPFWDGSTSLPAVNDATVGVTSDPNVSGISTITPNTLNIAFTANITEPTAGTAVAPYLDEASGVNTSVDFANSTTPSSFDNSSVVAFIGMSFYFSAPLVSGGEAQFAQSPDPTNWVIIADAIPVGLPVPPTGVWASTEAKDMMAMTGFVPITGVMAAVEAKDKFTGAPAQVPYDSIGWLGCVPATAVLAATEATDRMTAEGWVIGLPCTGRMNVREAPDRMATTNRASVTGTWASTEAPDRLASTGFEIPKAPPPATRSRRKVLIVS